MITSPLAAGKSPRAPPHARAAPPLTDRLIAALEAALASRPPLRAPPDGGARAAVALLLRAGGGGGLELLLIRRAEREGDPWSGHMALPGGRRQADDADLAATAARETREEVGIDVGAGRLLGELDELAPRSARIPAVVVSSFVYHVPGGAEPVPDPREVQAALWVPVGELLHPDAAVEYLHDVAGGGTLAFPAFDARGSVVWGMTHRILAGFLELYAQAVTPADPT